MSSKFPQGFRLGPWTVEPLRGAVTGPNGEAYHLEPKVMDVFVCLAEHVNEIVPRKQLLDTAWSGDSGSDEQLTRAIGEIRRVFRETPGNPKYIETIPKRGYRLIEEVRFDGPGEAKSTATVAEFVGRFSGKTPELIAVTLLALVLVYVVTHMTSIDATINGTSAGEKSIAVLPLVNLSDDPKTDYFSDGLSGDILNVLARIHGLKVVGRTSSFSFKGKNEDIRVVGRKLGVKTILEGTVFVAGEQVRITAQLVEVSGGTIIWSDSYQRTMTDIFEVQNEIAAAISDGLNIHFSKNPTHRRPTDVVEAYVLFLKARAALNSPDSGADAAVSELVRAIELDPDFAEANELLAHLYWTRYLSGIDMIETKELMRKSAAAALASEPELVLARALNLLGSSEKYTSPEIIDALSKAAHERPNDPTILRTLTWELMIAGYLDQALRAAEQYIDIDPLSAIAHIRYAAVLNAIGRIDESIAEMEVAAAITPDNLDWYFGELFLGEKQYQAAIEYMEAYLRQNGDADPVWIEDLITRGRNSAFGSAYIDQRIPVIVQSIPPEMPDDFQDNLKRFHLFFGYLDRYFEIILAEFPDNSAWTGVDMYVWYGMLHQDLGFTAHPDYLKVAKLMGVTDVWEKLGPPDFCSNIGGQWVCE